MITSKTAFGLSGTPTLTLVQFYNGKHKGRISPPFVFFYLISPRAFIDAFSFSILSSLILPSAPKQFLNYFTEDDRPQAKLDRNLEGGMAVSIGRLREDSQYDYKFVCLSHNTLRGAAGGAVLLAELLAAKGYFD